MEWLKITKDLNLIDRKDYLVKNRFGAWFKAYFKKGLSIKEREDMKNGKIPMDYEERFYPLRGDFPRQGFPGDPYVKIERWKLVKEYDESDKNKYNFGFFKEFHDIHIKDTDLDFYMDIE